MSATFSRTVRSLNGDPGKRNGTWLVISMLWLGAWATWFCAGRVSVYEVSRTARLEATERARPVVALVPGQIVSTELGLGEPVEAGSVLVQLDDRAERLALDEGRARIAETQGQLDALAAEIAAEKEAVLRHQQAGKTKLDQHRSRSEEARIRARHSKERFERAKKLVADKAMSREEYDRRRSETETDLVALETLRIGLQGVQHDQRVEEADREVRLAHLQSLRAELAGQLLTDQARSRRLQREVELRQIRAPIAGRIGKVAELPVGAAVSVGERLAFVVPESEPRAVAMFPVTASGRIRRGQTARLGLDGFSWTQYGHLPAIVKRVANEPDGSLLRVEFQLTSNPGLQIPVEHGLPGAAEVLTERVPPVLLVLRRVGGLLKNGRRPEPSQLARGIP